MTTVVQDKQGVHTFKTVTTNFILEWGDLCLLIKFLDWCTDIGALQKEVGALEELSRQLFVESVEMHAIKVQRLCDHIYIPADTTSLMGFDSSRGA